MDRIELEMYVKRHGGMIARRALRNRLQPFQIDQFLEESIDLIQLGVSQGDTPGSHQAVLASRSSLLSILSSASVSPSSSPPYKNNNSFLSSSASSDKKGEAGNPGNVVDIADYAPTRRKGGWRK